MRLFYGFLAMFLLCFPMVRWYLSKYNRVPNFLNVYTPLIGFVLVFYLLTMLLHLWLPGFREHMEPVLTEISLMYLAGYPLYSVVDDPNIYSMIYGPSTLLIQAQFLKVFDDPIFAVKVFGVSCILISLAVLYYAISRRFNKRIAWLGLFYFSALALLFGQVSFRNHSDCSMFLGVSLAVASVLLPSSWRSILLLAAGAALAINAKFHSAAFIFPLLLFFYRQHGPGRFAITIVVTLLLLALPFTMDGVSIGNYIALISAYSGLWVHPVAFAHNVWMTLTMLIPVFYLYFVEYRSGDKGLGTQQGWTLLLTLAMVLGVGLLGAVDGAGLYHMAPFAPLFTVLFVLLYEKNQPNLADFMNGFGINMRAVYMTVFIAWFASMYFFTFSIQKKVFNYARENYSHEVKNELLDIKALLQGKDWQVLVGYTDHPNHKYTYYRSVLWPVVKGNIVDPVVFAGRQAVGVEMPDATINRFAGQYYDVIIMPKAGEPFSMDNWHNRNLMVFGEQIPVLFRQNYTKWKSFDHFVLWRARRHG